MIMMLMERKVEEYNNENDVSKSSSSRYISRHLFLCKYMVYVTVLYTSCYIRLKPCKSELLNS